MAIVNVTPDSFADGGRPLDPRDAIARARQAIADGADIVDIGAESTRPGSQPLAADDEWARLAPVLRELRDASVPISVDTRKPELMRRALDAGASMINDVGGFATTRRGGRWRRRRAALCIMHMQGEPATMQDAPHYVDVVTDVAAFLAQRAAMLTALGVADDRLVVDPGFGFGKTLDHNLALLRSLSSIASLGWPVLVGLSRKGTIGALTGRPVGERLAGSVAAALLAVDRGAAIVRVHDVAATVDALAVRQAAQEIPVAADNEARPVGRHGP